MLTGMTIRLLLLADTHLGLDMPLRPRVSRPRRGPDFFANTRRALEPALTRRVDLVVHGGDLLYRSRVPRELVRLALEPLLEVADREVPVILVPGNHERSSIPFPLLAAHPHLHVLEAPSLVELELGGLQIALGGFACIRNGVRDRFADQMARTGLLASNAPIRLLCIHQTLEGARVGPSDYTFRSGPDIVPGRFIPPGLAAVLAGHIHRAQVLRTALAGRPLAAPVLYPGSIERTSRAERDEPKGFVIAELEPGPPAGGRLVKAHWHHLPTRPMIDLELDCSGLDDAALQRAVATALEAQPPDAIVRILAQGRTVSGMLPHLPADVLRGLAPAGMIVEWSHPAAGRHLGPSRPLSPD